MIVKRLTLTGFKNIAGASLEFSPRINCLLGDNGMGKSNLLDALYVLSYCRSFSGLADSALIRRGDEFAMLRGDYRRRGADEDIAAVLRAGRRKSLKRGGKEYGRLADHIGLFPLVLVSPADMELVSGEAGERRRFLDQIAAQSEPRFLDALQRYGQALMQRNRLLKADTMADGALFDAIELQMEAAATIITEGRRRVVENLRPLFAATYAAIAGATEVPGITYRPSIPPDETTPWSARRARDRAAGFTTAGPHRDEVEMLIGDAPVRRVASQGQAKTYTTALRLAQHSLLHRRMGISPLLLLDDIFDKLDSRRVAAIVRLVGSGDYGQIFITDTNRAHLDEIVGEIAGSGAPARLWSVSDGNFTLLDDVEPHSNGQ